MVERIHLHSGEPEEYRQAAADDDYVYTYCSRFIEVARVALTLRGVTCKTCIRMGRASGRRG